MAKFRKAECLEQCMKQLEDRITSARFLIKHAQAKLLEQTKINHGIPSSQVMQQQALQPNVNITTPQYLHANSLSALPTANDQVPDIDKKLSKLNIMSAEATPQPIFFITENFFKTLWHFVPKSGKYNKIL